MSVKQALLGLSFVCFYSIAASQEVENLNVESDLILHHDLKVFLDPESRQINVEDVITLPENLAKNAVQFSLNSDLSINESSHDISILTNTDPNSHDESNATGLSIAETNTYALVGSDRTSQIRLNYSGSIYDLAEQDSEEYAQSFSETSGIIDELGVYLNYASAWVPNFGDSFITFEMEVKFADSASGWKVVSQGDRNGVNGWRSDDPMEEIYLIAAEFTEYSVQADDVEVLAYLRTPDSNLATKYMDATERYLNLYEPLIGTYPFSKFALVENFWETGYGMPSFTLLGEQIIRFPFILESSYPHEILHNWWGNSVYPDYATGNWSEGLTAYLADHLFRAINGTGHEYRKEMLARYKNYVSEASDFPLSKFTSRNSAASQAIGYGKTLMLWHMLRSQLGDELFIEGLQALYSEYKYKRTSFEDIERLFSSLSGRDLSLFFDQWVNRTGAPELSISVEEATNNRARITFAQTHFDGPYLITVPVAIFYDGQEEPQLFDVDLSQKLEGFFVENYDRMEAVLVDPYFDVFRQLDREETPPTVGELFGSSRIAFILPDNNRQHWVRLAEEFGGRSDFEIIFADSIQALPEDRSVWVLGNDNPFVDEIFSATNLYGVADIENGIEILGGEIEYENRSTVMIGRHPNDPELAIGWIHVDDVIAMPGMIEKLPHYGKYSYLSFTGSEPTNDVKGVWSSPNSPMQWVKEGSDYLIESASLPVQKTLTTLPPKYLPERLLRHVSELTDERMQGRGIGSGGIEKAAAYISEQFRLAGLEPINGSYQQKWLQKIEGSEDVELTNVVGIIPGVNKELETQPVIIGAHYDHIGIDENGVLHPGADDNASGISVLIEVAAKLSRAYSPQRPIIFVAFSGEESGLFGSEYFIKNPLSGFESDDYFAMVNVDSIGRLDGKNLQIFGSESAYEWPFIAQGIGFTIGVQSEFPTETIASGDHVSFLNSGIPAIHLFSGMHLDFHQPSDTLDKLDLNGMSDVALWLEEASAYLGDRTDPLRVNLENAKQIEVQRQTSERSASLGTVPDFAYSGEGIRISGVTPGGAAEEAGLQAQDVLLNYDGETIEDMQSYSNLLRESEPGDTIAIDVLRDGQTISIEATLKAR